MDNITKFVRKQENNNHKPIQAFLYQQLWQSLDWIYPPLCAGCKTLGYRFCPECIASSTIVSGPICALCGQPVFSKKITICSSCLERKPVFTKLRSWAIYEGPIREALINMKFHQDFGISEFLGSQLCQLLSDLAWKFDMIIPVPLNPFRQKQRGYNQSYRLALPISLQFQLPIVEKALFRIRNTTSQAELSRELRLTNLIDAFEADSRKVNKKTILLVDDIATTSSTINACSTALLARGADKVYGLTAARTL